MSGERTYVRARNAAGDLVWTELHPDSDGVTRGYFTEAGEFVHGSPPACAAAESASAAATDVSAICPRCDTIPEAIRAEDINQALRASIHPDEAHDIYIRPIYRYTAAHRTGRVCEITDVEFEAMARAFEPPPPAGPNTLAHQQAEDERRLATWPEDEPGMKAVVLASDGDAWQRQWDENPDDARWARAASGQQSTESWDWLQRVLGPVRLLHPSPFEDAS